MSKWSEHRHRPYWVEYRQHRKNSKRRKIPFLISYDEWMQVWLDSGRLLERGCFKHGYVMARFNDTGPYAVGNVKIILMPENTSETKMTDELREVHRRNGTGRKHTAAAKEKTRLAKLGPKNPQFGKPRSPEIRAKISAGLKRYREELQA